MEIEAVVRRDAQQRSGQEPGKARDNDDLRTERGECLNCNGIMHRGNLADGQLVPCRDRVKTILLERKQNSGPGARATTPGEWRCSYRSRRDHRHDLMPG